MSTKNSDQHKQWLLIDHTEIVHEFAQWLEDTFGNAPEAVLITGSAGPLSIRKHFTEGFQEEPLPGDAPSPSTEGHSPKVLVGDCLGTRTAWFGGRVHLNEDPSDIYATSVFVRAAIRWGAKKIVLTNAVGAVNQSYAVGDVLLVDDHIDLFGNFGPLAGHPETISQLGTRFLDCEEVYDEELQDLAKEVFERTRPFKHLRDRCVLALLPGPHFETPAVVRFLAKGGIDSAGMSVVHEALAAHQMQVPVLTLSMVTNMCVHHRRPKTERSKLSHENNLKVVEQMDVAFGSFIANILKAMTQGIESVERTAVAETAE